MKELLGIIATVLLFLSYIPYVRDVMRGKTKPHIYSWFVWGLETLLVAALQIQKGAGPGAYVTIGAGAISLFVFVLGLRNGRKDITKIDTTVFIAALMATLIWIFAKQPGTSMILLVTSGALGSIPTFRKSWHKPHEETLAFWMISPIRHLLSIFAITSYNLVTVLNPAVWVGINTCMTWLLIARRKKILN